MKMKIIQLSDFLYNMPDSDIENLAIYSAPDTVLVDGETVLSIMLEHTFRSMLIPAIYDSIAGYSQFFTEYRYKFWLKYRLPDIIRSLQAVIAEYDPLSDYELHEKYTELQQHGDKTTTRAADAEHNKTTTSQSYDYTTTDEAIAGSPATYSNYVTTFENTTPRMESQRIDTGGRQNHTTGLANANIKTVTDDLKTTRTESRSTASLADGDLTLTADDIKITTRDETGDKAKTKQELLQSEIQLHIRCVLYDFIYEFLNKYTFFASNLFEAGVFDDD